MDQVGGEGYASFGVWRWRRVRRGSRSEGHRRGCLARQMCLPGILLFVQLRDGLSRRFDRRTFPSQVQNVPLWSGVFEARTWSMAETDSAGVIIPSTSQSSSTFAISLLPVSLASVMNNSGSALRCDFPGVHG